MPLNNEQSRQFIDASQLYAGFRATRRSLRANYRYAPRWRTICQRDYFYIGGKSLGARSPETEAQFEAYSGEREALQSRLTKLKARLVAMAPVNRALRLGRVPRLPARILRALDGEGLFGQHLRVIGTHALYGYEAAIGDYFQADLLATTDLDLCWDARERLQILADDGTKRTIISVLKRVDRSFRPVGFDVANDENFLVQLISPETDAIRPATGLAGDMVAGPIPEVSQLLAAPPFSAMAIGEDGLPVQIICPQPDAFVAHKRKIGANAASHRSPVKRRRDLAQAAAVAAIAPTLNATGAMYTEPVTGFAGAPSAPSKDFSLN